MNGVFSRTQIKALREAIDIVLEDAPKPVTVDFRENVARTTVRIAEERDIADPSKLVELVRAELLGTPA